MREGTVIAGKYRVTRQLGMGGMGAVFEAQHVELGQRVAVKIMLGEALADPEHVERFQRVGRLTALMTSEHIVRILEVGMLDGSPYLIMEYLRGADLSQVLAKGGPLEPHEAVDYILQACEGIAEAHKGGVVHRDIKPTKLFLTAHLSGAPLVKVLDVGIASGLTQTQSVLGSPAYMSPEALRSVNDAEVRSDIWSLGVCLYELLTGGLPFDTPTLPELCDRIRSEPPRPISELRSDLPPELTRVVMRCLEKDPADRCQDIAAFAAELEPFAPAPGAADSVRTILRRSYPPRA